LVNNEQTIIGEVLKILFEIGAGFYKNYNGTVPLIHIVKNEKKIIILML